MEKELNLYSRYPALDFGCNFENRNIFLGGAEFMQAVMLGSSSSLYVMLPCVIFSVSIALAFATGTSYGTFGVMIPIVIAVFPVDSPLLIIGISACLAGSVCGDHCSPISDTTVMSVVGAGVDHLRNHIIKRESFWGGITCSYYMCSLEVVLEQCAVIWRLQL